MSPVTAIQCALELEEQGYSKAIATIIYTATSIDSVYMVSLFSAFYSFALRLWYERASYFLLPLCILRFFFKSVK